MASRKVFSKKSVANQDHFGRPTPIAVEGERLNEGAERFKLTSTDEIWRGTVQINPVVDVPVYFRMGPVRAIVSELICAVLGRTMGLPIPRPYLIEVSRTDLPSSTVWRAGEKKRFTFACADLDGSSTFTQIIQQNSEYAKKLLGEWELYPDTVVFDEWVGNTDRNYSNMLFSANVIWLIDHAEALGGTMGELFDLSEICNDSFLNGLLSSHADDFSFSKKVELLEFANDIMKYAATIDLNFAVGCASIDSITDVEKIKQILEFLGSRLTYTVPFIKKRLGQEELDLINAT